MHFYRARPFCNQRSRESVVSAFVLSNWKSVKCRCVKCGVVGKFQAKCTSVWTKEQLPDFPVYLQHSRKVYLWITVSEADPLQEICVKVHFVVWGADCASIPSRALLSLIFISLINPNIPFIQTITSYPFAATCLLKAVLWQLRTFSLKADVWARVLAQPQSENNWTCYI